MSRSMSLRKYASVFNIGLQNTFVYRWNYFLRALFGLIPLAGTVFLWSAVFKERDGGLHGYETRTVKKSCQIVLRHLFTRGLSTPLDMTCC